MTNSNYTKDDIKVISDLDHIRLRKSLYIGDAIDPFHLLLEVMDNSVDEIQSGNGTHLSIVIDTTQNKYTVSDDGRGIPHGTKLVEGEEVEIVKLLCTKLNSGGKFDSAAYKISSGLHGQGLCCVNGLSSYMTICSTRDGESITYFAHEDKLVRTLGFKHGTKISFIPDAQYFQSSNIPLDKIIRRCRTTNAFGIDTTLIVDDKNIDVTATMQDLFSEESDLSLYHQYPVIYSSENVQDERITLFMRYTSDTKDKYYGYTNLLYNSAGGTHISFISKVICDAWLTYIQKSKIKLDVELHKFDYLVGLRAIVAVFINNPEFSSQTKDRLSVDKNYFQQFFESFKTKIVKYLFAEDKQSRALIKRFEEYRISQNKLLNRKQIASLIKENTDSPDSIRRRSLVPGLIECIQTKRDNTELYIVEGLSAIGPITRTRNKYLQAGLPLRGKILNVTGMKIQDALKSEVIRNITNAIGCHIGPNCDSSKSRYDRIIIAADSDPDGSHIQNLILSVLVNLLADIVKDGRVYIVEPPLYGWSDKSGKHYTDDLNVIPKNVRYTRYKGLGEFCDDEYEYCLMNPKTRKLYQVEYPNDLDEFNRLLGTASGKNDILKTLGLVRYCN